MSKQRDKNAGRAANLSRRKFMGTAASVAAAGTITGFPNIVQAADPIRTIGLGVSIINEIQSKAAKDVGFKIRGQAICLLYTSPSPRDRG